MLAIAGWLAFRARVTDRSMMSRNCNNGRARWDMTCAKWHAVHNSLTDNATAPRRRQHDKAWRARFKMEVEKQKLFAVFYASPLAPVALIPTVSLRRPSAAQPVHLRPAQRSSRPGVSCTPQPAPPLPRPRADRVSTPRRNHDHVPVQVVPVPRVYVGARVRPAGGANADACRGRGAPV